MDFIFGDLAYEDDCSTFKDLINHPKGYTFWYQATDTLRLMIMFFILIKKWGVLCTLMVVAPSRRFWWVREHLLLKLGWQPKSWSLGKPCEIKLKCYWEHFGEQLENLGNLMGTCWEQGNPLPPPKKKFGPFMSAWQTFSLVAWNYYLVETKLFYW
jgi:hypothetical protein